MAVDIFNIKPSVISKDLKGKFVCIYSLPKCGKTTLACQFPKNLLLGFEHGWNAISGAMAVDVTKWVTFKQILRQLEKPEARELYDTITIDTVGIAWQMCEDYICAQNGVSQISDIPWGGGFSACKKEFENCLRKITQLGFGLVIISHVEKRLEKRADDTEVEILGPQIPRRAYDIVNQLVDIIGYIDITWDENGNPERWLYTRKTPTVMAGSRFKYLAPKIKFGYQELVDAISEAIDKAEKEDGATVVDKKDLLVEEKLDFSKIYNEAKEVWTGLLSLCPTDEEKERTVRDMNKKIEMVFGRKIKLSEVTEDQVDLLNLVLLELKDMLSEKQK